MAFLPGAFSAKAAAHAYRKLRNARARKTARLSKDEGGTQRAEIPVSEINHPTNQGKRGAVGSVSRGGGAGRESQEYANHVDAPRNRRQWPGGSGIAAKNPATGNTRMRGPIAPSGPLYGGGGRNTQ